MFNTEERQPQKGVAVGGTGTGKSTRNLKFLREIYSNPANPNARKSLIYDVNMEYGNEAKWGPIPALEIEHLSDYRKQSKIEIRRILPLDPKTNKELGVDEKWERFEQIVDDNGFKNGCLYLEDINNWSTSKAATGARMISLLTSNRQRLLDIFISVQTFGALPPRLWGNLDILQIHRTNDDPFQTKVKNQLGGKTEPIKIAYLIVSEKVKTDPYFCLWVNFKTMKITGPFSPQDFLIAAKKYLAVNRKKVKETSLMYKCSKEAAENRLLYELMETYNGNVKPKK